MKVSQLSLTLRPHGLNSLGQNTGVGSLSLLQRLPDPGIEPGSPASQADSLPTELSGKPQNIYLYYYYYQLHRVFVKVHGLSCTTACEILGTRPGIKPASPALKAWNLNHWTGNRGPGNRKAQPRMQCLLSAKQGLGVVFTTFFSHLKLKHIPGGRYFCFLMRKGSERNRDLSSVPELGWSRGTDLVCALVF